MLLTCIVNKVGGIIKDYEKPFETQNLYNRLDYFVSNVCCFGFFSVLQVLRPERCEYSGLIVLYVSIVLTCFSVRSLFESTNPLKTGASVAWLGTLIVFLISACASIYITWDKTIWFQTIHDYYFCSDQSYEQRKEKWQELINRQFVVIDRYAIDNPDESKTALFSKLGHMYFTEASDDRVNHLKLSEWFFQKGRDRVANQNNSEDLEYFNYWLSQVKKELKEHNSTI